MEKNLNPNLFKQDAQLGFKDTVTLGFQHVVAMVVGCVTPAIVISKAAGLSPEDTVILIQASLIFAGVGTLIQNFRPLKIFGSSLPMIMGVSFAYMPSILTLVLTSLGEGKPPREDMAVIFGAQLVGGLWAVIFGIFVKKIIKFFPQVVTGTVILSIGLGLYPVAVRYMAGGGGAKDFGSLKNWGVALFTLGVVIICQQFGKGIVKLAAILIGMIAGFFPKLSAVLTTIPQPDLGGATISVFANISMTGVKMLHCAGMSPKNVAAVGISLAVGEGIARVGGVSTPEVLGALSGFPVSIQKVFGSSATTTTTLLAVILNLILPKDKAEIKSLDKAA